MRKTITESQLRQIVKESVKKVLREAALPSYEQPVYIGCDSKEDAEFSVEIGYSEYASSLFYVGPSYDEYEALETVVRYLVENGIVNAYTGDEEMAAEYPDDYVDVLGYPIAMDKFVVHKLK